MLNRHSRSWTLLVLALPAVLAWSGPAIADEAAEAARLTELNESGTKLYRERSYHRAIEKFIEAYAIDRDPNLLYNIARCYEELGDGRAAIEKYTAYLNAPGADAAGRLRAEQSLRALVALQKHASTEANEPAASGEDTKRSAVAAPGRPAAGTGYRIWAWSALGAGALVAGLGGGSFYLGVQDHQRVTSSPGYGNPQAVAPMTLSQARALVSSGDDKKVAGAIGLGLGGALLATAATLFVWSRSDKGDGADTVALSWSPSGGGFRGALTLRF